MPFRWTQRLTLALLASACAGQTPPDGLARALPAKEALSYTVEWRLIHAGNARLDWAAAQTSGVGGWSAAVHLESVGLVSKLFKVNNDYTSLSSGQMCVADTLLRANEGSKRRETHVVFDHTRHKANYTERDLNTKAVVATHEIDIRPCEQDVIGALYRLRTSRLQPGQTAEFPVSDGKKAIVARVEAQEREKIKTDAGTFQTIRYEAFLFNNVLYRRRGRLFVWLTDDERRLPVQIRIRLPFYIGTVTLQLQKEGKS